MIRPRRSLAIAAGVLILFAVALVVALHVAARQLQPRIEAALGPRASIGAIAPGWTGVELRDLRIKAAPGWPAKDELRAARVRVVPDLPGLLAGHWRIASVRVEGGYLSVLRTADGKLRLLPALLDDPHRNGKPAQGRAAPAIEFEIGQVQLEGATFEFFDHSVRPRPRALRLERLDAQAGPLLLPRLDHAVDLRLTGVFKGPQRDGRIAIDGVLNPSTRDADLRARLSGVDMVPLQPYVLKRSETAIRRGALDLDLHAKIVRNKLRAPGRLTLTDLELVDDGPLATFAGVPRNAVLAAMTERGRLEVAFTLDGRLEDPSFSLNENLATKIAAGVAESLGVSLSGAVKGLGGVVKGLFGR